MVNEILKKFKNFLVSIKNRIDDREKFMRLILFKELLLDKLENSDKLLRTYNKRIALSKEDLFYLEKKREYLRGRKDVLIAILKYMEKNIRF